MSQINFEEVNSVYFIGIGGIGVSAVARMFLLRGAKVSGSDLAPSAVTEELEALGATVFYGQGTDNIPEDCDLVIYTIVIPPSNPDMVRAKEMGVRLMTYPEVLGLISRSHKTVAISGTHGKTTTTAMTAEALIAAELDPTVIVGSLLKGHKSNFVPGDSDNFIVEACEYRESFHELDPDILVITNIEADHLDYYRDIDHIIDSFNKVVKKVPATGAIITDPSDKNISRALEGAKARVIDYTEQLDKIEVAVPGEHNRKNAAAALSVADVLGADMDRSREALRKFSGTWRRFEEKGKTAKGSVVYDDYAHHPTEIKATLSGAREAFPDKKIIAIFQPHLFSRTKDLLLDFADSFSDADAVIVLPIYAAREEFDSSISHEMLASKISGVDSVSPANDLDDAVSILGQVEESESIILTLGAGDVYKLSEMIIGGSLENKG